ncbi:MAG TPA: sulfotransferase [Burkholderiales bacterium]|nr:sulfotransferase [Burkholderiales bacterium]
MSPDYPEFTVIVGSGRSGTTLLVRLFRQCLDIGIGAEPGLVVRLYRRLPRFGDLRQPGNLRRLVETIHAGSLFDYLHRRNIATTADEILALVREPTYTGVLYAVFELIARKRGKSRLGYKDPADVFHLPILAELLPTARFVHIVRDGRDVALSMLGFNRGPNNLYAACRYWERGVSKARADGRLLGERYFELRLEDLVTDTDRVAAQLGNFVNRGRDAAQTAKLVERINEMKNHAAIDKWRKSLDRRQRFICEAAAGETLRACGYATEFAADIRLPRHQTAYYELEDFALRVKNRLLRGLLTRPRR